MSTAAPPPIKDQHLALMHEMGADQYDPMPPGQYLAKMNKRQTLSPRGQQLLGWIQQGCIRWKPGAPRGGRNPFATVDGKRPLKLTDAAAHFGWDMPAVSRVWGELQQKGYVKKDDSGRLRMIGEPEMPEEAESNPTIANPKAKITIPGYVRLQFDANPRGREAETAYVRTMELINTINAEAMAGSRAWGEKFLAAVMAYYDVKLRRHNDGEDTEKDARRKVQVNILEMSVQDFLEGIIRESEQEDGKPVQTTGDTLYSEENAPVQDSYPYSSENREYRVSREDAGAESVLSCEDSLENPEPPFENEETAPATAGTIETENLSVDGESSQPTADENNTVVAYVENYFEQPLTPQLREQWANFAHEAELTPTSVVRFLMAKTAEKEQKQYDLDGPSVLLKFARVDIKRWKKTNRGFIARDFEREQARRSAPAASEAPDPLEEFESLQRTLEALTPKHPQYETFSQRAEVLRHSLELDLAACCDLVALDPENPAAEQTRARIARLKPLLTTKADGAAG